jgi:hypothetical protein
MYIIESLNAGQWGPASDERYPTQQAALEALFEVQTGPTRFDGDMFRITPLGGN